MNKRARTVLKLLAVQAAVIAAVTTIFFVLGGLLAAFSAGIGGVIGLSATALSCMHILFGRMQWLPQFFLKQLFHAEALKMVLIAIMAVVAMRYLEIPALPMMLTLVAVLLANWPLLLFDT
ncbi:MAG: ATP synthase subunit I [Gammaproteobacteria bacterium]|nr:ATP synthase subunit I [Gammaproteobacteria bacterium]